MHDFLDNLLGQALSASVIHAGLNLLFALLILLVGIWAITCIAGGELTFFWPIFPIGFWALGNVAAMFSGWGQGGGGPRPPEPPEPPRLP